MILPAFECSLIQKFENLSLNITNFISFWQIINALTQNDRGFEKYELRKKFIFRQTVVKIANFAVILGKITEYLGKRNKKNKTRVLKLSVTGNHEFYQFSSKW